MSYEYLFPYEKVPYLSKIIIYGAGDLGQDYLRQMEITHFCDVVALADRNYAKYKNFIIPVIAPSEIHDYSFDYVVVALRMESAFPEILRVLNDQNINRERIICIFERQLDDISIMRDSLAENIDRTAYAFDESKQSIAILSTGGYGDMVIHKRFINELIKYAPLCKIDFYNIKAIGFLKHLYSDTENVKNVFDDLGYRYHAEMNNYSLALTIEACHFIRVDKWDEIEALGYFPSEFVRRIGVLKNSSDMEAVGINTPAYLTMTRRRFKGLNAYSGFNYDGAFDIRDKKVNIPLDKIFAVKFKECAFGRYITVNYGNGDSESSEGIAKCWSKESFESLIRDFRNKYPNTSIIQLGGKNAYRLKGADQFVLGEDFRFVLHTLKNSLLHIDIEGGLVHIASQLGTKCIVLFGPTVPDYYGYEENINIRSGDCRECWGLYSNVNRCARDMKEPICMKRITPEMVSAKIDEYMEVIGCQK